MHPPEANWECNLQGVISTAKKSLYTFLLLLFYSLHFLQFLKSNFAFAFIINLCLNILKDIRVQVLFSHIGHRRRRNLDHPVGLPQGWGSIPVAQGVGLVWSANQRWRRPLGASEKCRTRSRPQTHRVRAAFYQDPCVLVFKLMLRSIALDFQGAMGAYLL